MLTVVELRTSVYLYVATIKRF